MTTGVLYNTRCLAIGPMEKDRSGGSSYRNRVANELQPLGIRCWNHYNSPIDCDISEGDNELFSKFSQLRQDGDFEGLAKYRQIRHNDLALIDKCDFVICQLDMETLSCGTWEELFLANRHKKPILVYCVQGKKSIPFWMWWTLPVKYFYNDLDEILSMIKKIDCGEIIIDSDRWKLLKQDYR